MALPLGPTPATDAVIKKTPPSGLALKIGNALRRRCRLALQLIAYIYEGISVRPLAAGGLQL